MTKHDQAGAADRAVSPSAFDFNAYISGQSTFPQFTHTVFLDQRSGIELHQLSKEYDKHAERGREILQIQSNMSESSTRSFVDSEAEELSDELNEIERVTAELAPQINELEKKIRQSSLKMVFQVGTAQKLGQVVRQAEKEFHKKNGRKEDTDIEYVTSKAKAILVAQLTAYCVKIVLPDGTEQDPPNGEGFTQLLDSLISSESVRLMTTLNNSLDSSSDWAEKIDAGFPGGRDEPRGELLAHPGDENGPVLVPSSVDPSDG